MALNPEILRFVLGVKLRRARLGKGFGLKELARRTGVSVSYLSEIEKGKKHPKPDKLLQLASALETPYEDLVSPRFEGELGPLGEIFESPFVQEFPFHLYGIEPEALFSLLTEAPSKARALVRTALEIGRHYELEVEHFLFAALRSYQDLHGNYFPAIEQAAADLRRERGWSEGQVPGPDALKAALADSGIVVDTTRLSDDADLADLRAVWVEESTPPRLLVNGGLLPSQQAFMMARELGYRRLGRNERSTTSPALVVESFDQVISDFEVAYFAGAVLLERDALVADLEAILGRSTWEPGAFLGLLDKYQATPETFFYRLSQLLPGVFGLRQLLFARFHHEQGSPRVRLTKILNMSGLAIPFGLEPQEHYCGRWPGVRLLAEEPGEGGGVRLAVQRSRRIDADSASTGETSSDEFFTLSLTRPLALRASMRSSVNLVLGLDENARRRLRFLDDLTIPQAEVHLTCERCPLSQAECSERAVPASHLEEATRRRRRHEALARLTQAVETDA